MKNLISLISLVLLLYSCGRVKNNDNADRVNSSLRDSLAGEFPGASTLSPPELIHYTNAVENFFESKFKPQRFNGSILIAKNGQVIYEKYEGYTNPRAKRDSIISSTPFHLASISKPITATVILKLWEEGRLDINDSVSKYLPSFPCTGVTVKTLLNHRSGLPNYVHYMEVLGWDKKRLITNQDVLDFIVQRHKEMLIRTADRHFSYSNTNYALLALIIEKVTGQSYCDYLKRAIFDPLGMKDSYVFTRKDSATAVPSFFYSGRQYAFDFLDMVYGDKNVYSTVRDLLKFDQAMNTGRLLKKETLQAAYSGYSFEKPGINNYGFGWRMFLLKNGKKMIYHNGWWHGYRTVFYRLIDENVTIVALCNNDYKRVYTLKRLANIFGNYFQKDEAEENETVNTNTNNNLQHYVLSQSSVNTAR